jgi:NitT/TauT family transport system ATP-binding protein
MLKQLAIENLSVRFQGAATATLEGIQLDVQPGQFLAIVGPSGCGKSTLLRVIAGLQKSTGGSVTTVAETEDPIRFGFVFQHPTLLPWRTAKGNLRLPFELGHQQVDEQQLAERVMEVLAAVGLSVEDANKRPPQMSGGMQMRLSLARGIIMNPDILLLDEPFAAVDDLLRLQLQEDVAKLHDSRQMTTILVTHNLHEAVFMSDRIVVLGGTPAQITADITIPAERPRKADFRTRDSFHAQLNELSRTVLADLQRTRMSRAASSDNPLVALPVEP